jgi:serine/threonine-protein kinase
MAQRRQPESTERRSGFLWRAVKLLFGGGAVILMMALAAGVGGYFALRLSARSSGEVTVPDLTGMTVHEAGEKLSVLGLRIEVQGERHDRLVARDLVLGQEPHAGVSTRVGRAIRVVRSLGEARVDVPELTGRPVREARLEAQRVGLRVGAVTHVAWSRPPDSVIAQQPPAGSPRSAGDPVDLLVSRGRRARMYVMPDLVGSTAEESAALLERAGIRVASARSAERTPGGSPGLVLPQNPAAGGPVRERQVVSLKVSQ